MYSKKWKKFEQLTEKCYSNMIGAEKDGTCWERAFLLLKESIAEEREKNPNFARQLALIDDDTDYQYEIQGWLWDCLDEMDMHGKHGILLNMCDDLLAMFSWEEYEDAQIKFMKSSALGALGRNDESVKYCREWMEKEPENIVAATAGVYAFMRTKEFDAAEELVERFILDKAECSDENDIMFTAASQLYEAMGKKKEKKQIDKAMKAYEDYLEQWMESPDFDADEWEFF